jgi:hypothetical protein
MLTTMVLPGQGSQEVTEVTDFTAVTVDWLSCVRCSKRLPRLGFHVPSLE